LNEHGRITRWKGANFEIAEPVLETGERPHPYAWCFSSDGSRLVRCGDDGAVRVWDIPSRTLWRQFTKFPGHARKVFAHGNRVLILSLGDFVVRDVDLMTGTEIQSWQAPADIIHFALSPDERHCVTLGLFGGDVLLTDLIEKATTKLNLNIRQSHDGSFSPDGRLLAVPSSLGFAQIVNTTNWAEESSLGSFFDEVFGSVFMSNGSRLAVAAGDQEAIRLYDTSTWLDTLTLEDDGGILWPTQVSPDDNIIGATTFWGAWRLRLWRAPSWEEIEAAEAREKALMQQR
jgi:WD40 repeat protein